MSEHNYSIDQSQWLDDDQRLEASLRNDEAVKEEIYRCLKAGVPRLDDLQIQREVIETLSKP
jgi:hypothetical protein